MPILEIIDIQSHRVVHELGGSDGEEDALLEIEVSSLDNMDSESV
jgi:hypothetical protein